MTDKSNAELLAELDLELTPKKKSSLTQREERIIAGFEEVQKFVAVHGRQPDHGESKDIFERLYAARLDRIRESQECRDVLESMDTQNLLKVGKGITEKGAEYVTNKELLAALGIKPLSETDITTLKHVKPRAEVRAAAEEIANRTPCKDFDKFKPLFQQIQEELANGMRETTRYRESAGIHQGEFFILGGQKVYVHKVGKEFMTVYDRKDSRLRAIYDNGTESNILLRSLQRALQGDAAGRRISDNNLGSLFSDQLQEGDVKSGTLYVLRSKSELPSVKENYNIFHKIGVTGGTVEQRIANAKNDPTFLLSEVEVVATYKLSNINRMKLEKIVHRVLEPAKLDIGIKDRFGKNVTVREWFLVPMDVIDDIVDKIKDGSISDYSYNPEEAKLNKVS